MRRLFFIILLVIVILFTGCSSKESAKVETVPEAPVKTSAITSDKLFLEITKPADKSTVNAESVIVSGKTLPIAILSVNGKLVKVGADGAFSTSIPLEIGPNVIQVVASDISGTEVGKVITVGRLQ